MIPLPPVPGFSLNLTACQLALIYAGNVTMWSDPRLQNLQAGINAWPPGNPALAFPIVPLAYPTNHT